MKLTDFSTYEELRQKCEKTGSSLVPPLDVVHKKIALVGEALGKDELFAWNVGKDKVPRTDCYFVGAAGKLLDRLFGDVGLPRSRVYITNVVKIRPPGNELKRLGELGLKIDDFVPLLKEELNEVNPDIIIPCGALALKVCTGLSGITKWRGSEVVGDICPRARYFPTLHPSYIQRGQWALYPFVRNDLRIAAEVSIGVETVKQAYEAIMDPSLDQSLEYIEECKRSEATVVDLETGFERIRCVGLAKDSKSGISIPFRRGWKNRWTYTEHCMILNALRELWESPTVKIAHNAEYDFLWLYPLIGKPREPIFCTMRAHALVYPEAPHDLGFIMASHTSMDYHKDEGKTAKSDDQLWDYNIKDVVGTFLIYEKLVEELKEIGMWEFFVGYTMPFFRLTLEMERVGIRVDKEMFERRKKTTQRKADGLQRAINREVLVDKRTELEELNVNSHKQVKRLLYDDWGLPEQRHFKTRKPTADAKALGFLYARYPNKIFRMIMAQRHLTAKILGTYLSDKIIGEDGHAHTSFGVTVTGRLSSRESDVFNSGTDLQNQPKKIRDMFIPDAGQVFVSVDLANAENRVQALLANMRNALQAFERGENVHLKVGEWVFGRIIDKEKESKTYRTLKAIQHGVNYRMGERTFATHVGKTVAEAKIDRQRYLEWVPELAVWHRWVDRQVTTGDRTLITPMGRKRTFTKPAGDFRLKTESAAHIPQSTVADVINLGGLGLWLCMDWRRGRMVLQIHDEWLVSLFDGYVEEWSKLATLHLETLRELEWDGRRMTVPAEFSGAKENWRGV